MCDNRKEIDIVYDLLSLNDDNLSDLVIANNDVQNCLELLRAILEGEVMPSDL